MPVNSALSTTIASGKSFYRITSLMYSTGSRANYLRVVDGKGALKTKFGGRYNYPGARTVYLTEDLETCFAEKMFYFHREVVRGIDLYHKLGAIPPFEQTFALWEIVFKNSINDVAALTLPGATNFFGVFPSLPLNPSQDYDHLKQKRADIESEGYGGIVVGSSRSTRGGNMVVLFGDQGAKLQSVVPHPVEFRLIDDTGNPFHNHTVQILDFTAGEVRFPSSIPTGGAAYGRWERIEFNH